MIKAELPVQKGFVLVVDAYKRFITFNKINIRIEKLLVNLDNNDFESIKKYPIKSRINLNKVKFLEIQKFLYIHLTEKQER
ncbi:MAG: hypothetical protein FH751_14110 [Firmicutes bacterium]|nr:hypothetical protein [Bacillota bacterium]